MSTQGVKGMVPRNMMGLYICFGLGIAALTVALAAGSVCYVTRCVRWRRRIAEVGGGQSVYLGWNLKKLKETVRELEYEKVSRMELLFP
jgi:hypothetical protein